MARLVVTEEVKQTVLSVSCCQTVRSPLSIRSSLTSTMLYHFSPRDPLTSRKPSPHYDIVAQGSRRALPCLRWVSWIFNEAERRDDAWLNQANIFLQVGVGAQSWCVLAVWPEVSFKAEAEIHLIYISVHVLSIFSPKTRCIYSCNSSTVLISNSPSSLTDQTVFTQRLRNTAANIDCI